MDTVQDKTYETIYYSLWEAARRYSSFTQFRVIGKSHADRMIPMLEIGQGDACLLEKDGKFVLIHSVDIEHRDTIVTLLKSIT